MPDHLIEPDPSLYQTAQKSAEAQSIRKAFSDAAPEMLVLMPETCDLLRPPNSVDVHLGYNRKPVPVAVAIPCRRRYVTAAEAADDARARSGVTFRFTLPLDLDVQDRDILRYQGLYYEVVGVPRSTFSVSTPVLTGDGKEELY